MVQIKDLCVEADLRLATDVRTALETCGLAGRRLPDMGEAEEGFNVLGAPQQTEWTGGFYFDGAAAEAVTIDEDSSRTINFGATPYGSSVPYRCVAISTT